MTDTGLDPIVRERASKTVVVVGALGASLVAVVLLVLANGNSPGAALGVLGRSAFSCSGGSSCAVLSTLERATPLILTGLSAAVAFRAGLFSIGQEGQLLIGMAVAGYLAPLLDAPGPIAWLVIGIAGATGGGLWGLLAGWLRARFEVNIVIATVVMNEIVLLVVIYLVTGPLRAPGGSTAYTESIPESARLPIWGSGSKFGLGFAVAIVAAIAVWLYLFRRSSGHAARTSGRAPRYAEYLGIDTNRIILRSMFMSGALAGTAGVIEVLGVTYKVSQAPSQSLGFDGLGVAVLGLLHPLGVVIVALIFSGVRLGAQVGLQVELQIPRELGGIVIALTMMFVAIGQSVEDSASRLVDRIEAFRRRLFAGRSRTEASSV